jgi:hypothetical protein
MLINIFQNGLYLLYKIIFSYLIMLTRFLTKSLFRATAIKSVPGNLPPRKEDNASGRYAGSLFSAASQK